MSEDDDGAAQGRYAALEARWAADHTQRVEAQRLLDLAGSSRTKLRVLSVICANDHTLIEVYRVGGTIVWEGAREPRDVHRWPDGTSGKLGKRRRRRIVGLLDADISRGVLRTPVGACQCGGFRARYEWLTAQMERDDLPASRRVVVPVKGLP